MAAASPQQQAHWRKMCYLRTKYRRGTLSKEWVEALESVGFDFNRKYSDNWRPFEAAREFVRALKLKGWAEWWAYCKSGKRPFDIPANPVATYKKEWRGANDWFGTGRRNRRTKSGWRPFKDARNFARSLKLKSQAEWLAYAKSGEKPEDIPFAPETVYEDEGWVNVADWLGYNRHRIIGWRSFEEARAFIRTLGLRSEPDWRKYCTSGQKPHDIPTRPHLTYKNEWVSLSDWIGYYSRGRGRWRSFEEARAFVRTLGLKDGEGWRAFAHSDKLPHDVPCHPHRIYLEYQDLGDWIGQKLRRRRGR